MSKHTPGPWKVDGSGLAVYSANESLTFAPMVATAIGERSLTELRADARLIAAAPELLEIAISNAEYRAARDSEFGRGYNAAKNGQRRDTQKESADWYAGYDAHTAIVKATGATPC